MSDGPLDIPASLKAYTAGTIIRPASIATDVSMRLILRADLGMSTSFFMYDPYVIMMPIARDIE